MKTLAGRHQQFMQRCLTLAQKGLGLTYPNPLVGCVIVHKGKIIGEGWHRKAGEAHAEVNAIENVRDKSLLSNSTLYVNLEPCNHHGRTPPCAHRIVAEGIPEVVVGCLDPFEKVNGHGIATLKKSGVRVITDILEQEAKHLNRRFFTFHRSQRPYLVLKWAESADGFLAPLPNNRSQRAPVYLTHRKDQLLVHQWRSEEQAILVGAQTVIDDNPRLTTRWVAGNNPIRIVIDPNHRLSVKEKVFDTQAKSLHLTHECLKTTPADDYKRILTRVLNLLYEQGIQSVIVEGGKKTLEAFIKFELWDEARIFTAPISLHQGIAAPHIKGSPLPSDRPDLQRLEPLQKQP